MKILYSEEFRKKFTKFPLRIRNFYSKQEKIFLNDWRDSRLQVKKLKDYPFPFSFRITRNYRVLFLFVDEEVALFATIGHRRNVYRRRS